MVIFVKSYDQLGRAKPLVYLLEILADILEVFELPVATILSDFAFLLFWLNFNGGRKFGPKFFLACVWARVRVRVRVLGLGLFC